MPVGNSGFASLAVVSDRPPLDVRGLLLCVRLHSLPDNPLGPVSVPVVPILESDMLDVRWLFLALHSSIVHPHVAADIHPDLFHRIVEIVVSNSHALFGQLPHAANALNPTAFLVVCICCERNAVVLEP